LEKSLYEKVGGKPDRLRLLEIRLLEAIIPGLILDDARAITYCK
jgi:hypothetical protein